MRLFFALAALLLPLGAFAQTAPALPASAKGTGMLTGTMTDAETGEPIPGVNVFLPEFEWGAATDLDGNYTVADIPAGTYTVQISYLGMKTREIAGVEISRGQTVRLDASLEEDPTLDTIGPCYVVSPMISTSPYSSLRLSAEGESALEAFAFGPR